MEVKIKVPCICYILPAIPPCLPSPMLVSPSAACRLQAQAGAGRLTANIVEGLKREGGNKVDKAQRQKEELADVKTEKARL